MASTSVRNLASHIAVVAYSNFRPISEKWSAPKKLPKGSLLLLKLMKDITGSYFRPIFPAYLLNEDCSIHYYFSGTAVDDPTNN